MNFIPITIKNNNYASYILYYILTFKYIYNYYFLHIHCYKVYLVIIIISIFFLVIQLKVMNKRKDIHRYNYNKM